MFKNSRFLVFLAQIWRQLMSMAVVTSWMDVIDLCFNLSQAEIYCTVCYAYLISQITLAMLAWWLVWKNL